MNDNKSDKILDGCSPSYLAQFRVHQEFVQSHIKGALDDEEPLLPAFFPPSSYWTSHEKNLFFHGLAVYSRFRPDLIAESIKTKTIFDVCLYLDILQKASYSTSSHGSLRSSLEPAMEVSTAWIQHEEKTAAALIQFDSCTWTPGFSDRNTKNPNSHCTCSFKSLPAVDYTEPSPVDHSSHTELKMSYLSHLDSTSLMALEKIVREAQLSEVDSGAVPPSPTPDSFGQPTTQTNPPIKALSGGIENACGDIALDTPEPPAAGPSIKVPKKPDYSETKDQYLLMKRLYMRRKRAESKGRSANMEAIRLRPGREIRDRKPPRPRPKMYKRKRKIPSSNSSKTKISEKPETGSASLDEMDEEDEAQYELRSKGGLNKINQTRHRFLEIGVDSQLASTNSLDFFHLSSLVQLMRLYGSFNDLTGPFSISADTIQLLAATVKEFISEVVRRSLISKEQEIRLKGVSKVWKYDQEEVTVRNVKETLKLMGIAHSGLQDYFAELVEEGNDDVSSPDSSIDTNMGDDDDDDDDVDDDNQQSTEPSQALPEFWTPEVFERCLLPKHTRVCYNDGDLLPEIDEIGLQHELAEEEKLDAEDLLASKEFEAGLWAGAH